MLCSTLVFPFSPLIDLKKHTKLLIKSLPSSVSLASGLWSFSEYRELNCNLFLEGWLENQTDLHGHLRRWRTLPTWRKKLLRMPGASTGDPTHDKGVAERAWRQRRIRTRGTPWTCLSIYPKTRVCLSYYFMTFTNSSDINRVLSPTTFFWRTST